MPSRASRRHDAGQYRISAIVSTYNAERLLPYCLEDLEAQTIAAEIEIVVVDSGSEQNERAVVEDFQGRYDNIVYLRTRRETLYASWNRALRVARGTYITNANTDDAHRHDALERLAAALDAYPEADLAYGNYAWTSIPNDTFADPHAFRLILHPPFHPAQSMFFCIGGCHPMWRRTVFDRIGRFDPSFSVIGDYEFLMRFAAAGCQAVHVPEVLTLFYQNPKGLTFTNDWRHHELSRLYPAYRERTPIHKLYDVDPRSSADVARAWVALGNAAMKCAVPWSDELSWDGAYAQFCYRRALDADSRCGAALHNLAMLMALRGQAKDLLRFLARLPAELRPTFHEALEHGRPRLMAVDVPPALKPLRYRGRPSADRQRARMAVRWLAPVFARSDAGAEAATLAVAVAERRPLGIAHAFEPYSNSFVSDLPAATRQRLFGLAGAYDALDDHGATVVQGPLDKMPQLPVDAYGIARTTVWTDQLPASWVARCQELDEFWVPSRFSLETFAANGVDRRRLFEIPPPVDEKFFQPERHEPWPLRNRPSFAFLAVLPRAPHDGSDILFSAYLKEFSSKEDVCLYVIAEGSAARSRQLQNQLRALRSRTRRPRVEIVDPSLTSDVARWYRSVDCLVAPRRAGDCHRSVLEAMAMGVPVIATNWGDTRELLNGRDAYMLDFDLVRVGRRVAELDGSTDHRWASPSEAHLRHLMRRVHQHPEVARRRANHARANLESHFSPQAVVQRILTRFDEIDKTARAGRLRNARSRAAVAPSGFIDLPHLSAARRVAARSLAGAERPARSKAAPPARARGQVRPRITAGLTTRRTADGIVISHGDSVHYLNRTAALIVELCTGRNSWDDIVELVRLAYGMTARPDKPVARVLNELLAKGVILTGSSAAKSRPPSRNRAHLR
ncbi:MAG TPA: PqqD family peptide modification chaperone [Vicinamibacterales bacterium]|nr:PqqD family peptide modification chaperone [Vicinamibacterales bacterium]